MSEKLIENTILQYLQIKGIYAWKNQSTGMFDAQKKVFRKSFNRHHIKGASDILGVLPGGKFLAIEVKTPKTKTRVSEHQKRFIDKINDSGGLAFCAWSLDMVIEKLKAEL